MLSLCLNPKHRAIQQSIQEVLPHPDSEIAELKGFDFVEDHQPTLCSVGLSQGLRSSNFSVAAELTVRLLATRHDEKPTDLGRLQLSSTAAALPATAGTLLPPQDSRTLC
jgi:hypothetical protein